MSIQYDKEIYSNGCITLKVNFSGIKGDATNTNELTMSIYAYDLNGHPKFAETLNYNEIKGLYEHLNQISIIKDSSKNATGKFIETSEDISEMLSKLGEVNSNILKTILNKLKDDEKINALFTSLSEIEIDDLFVFQKRQIWQDEINNLEKLLILEENGNIVEEIKNDDTLVAYVAGQPEKIFQNWVEKNHLWVFGIEYIKKYDAHRIAFFSEGDLLMESIDGFLDLIELKRPKLEIFKYDESHKSNYPSLELSKAIGQCLFYLEKMDDFKLMLEKEHKLKILRPRIKIIGGRTKDFDDEKYNSLRMLNSNLNHIQIVSYDFVLNCGKKMIENLTN